jgi:molybdate transport system regulatory protein
VKDLKLESKFRIVKDGEKVFGIGPCILLETVGRLGSLNKAAKELNMSYSKAWTIINKAEKALGYSLLQTYTGGVDGGGSCLTPEAKVLIKAYKGFSKEAELMLEKLYRKYFKDI